MKIQITPLNRGKIINPHRTNFNELKEKRGGILLHYDDSSSDSSAAEWFKHPECAVSYNYLVLDDGSFHQIAPSNKRAWHAGVCRSSSSKLSYLDANSFFIGIAAATNGKTPATQKQILTISGLCRLMFEAHGWNLNSELWRISGHADEAWPRGRRIDPYGFDPRNPILDPKHIRELVPSTQLVP